MQYLATFPNQMQALAYAGALSRRGIPYRLMPRPRALEASCGTAVGFVPAGAFSRFVALPHRGRQLPPGWLKKQGMACITAVCAVPLGKIKRIVPFFGFDPFYFCGEGVSL